MKLFFIIVLFAAIAYGSISGYIFAHGEKEPVALDVFWKACVLVGFYAFISFCVAMTIYLIFGRK